MILNGYVRNKNGHPIKNALVEIKGDDFSPLYRTESDETGYYKFDIPPGKYPYLIAVKDYTKNFLEYWCQNILLEADTQLDVSFDTLEIYGLHAFRVKGAYNSLMVYFRPMSLAKFQRNESDIAPSLESIKALIDAQEVPVLLRNHVLEYAKDRTMTAYLIQVDTTGIASKWNRLDIEIRDDDGNLGAASIFNN